MGEFDRYLEEMMKDPKFKREYEYEQRRMGWWKERTECDQSNPERCVLREHRHGMLFLTDEEARRLYELLENPPKPTEALKAAIARHRPPPKQS